MLEWTELFFSDVQSSLRVGSYFLVFGCSLATVLLRWPIWNQLSGQPRAPKYLGTSLLLAVLAFYAFYVTWDLILDFFNDEARLYANHPEQFAASNSTFVKAYVEVTEDAAGWWWSSQLLLWVIPGCVFLQTQSRIFHRELPWSSSLAYTATGFLGAISLSFPLFFAHVLHLKSTSLPHQRNHQRMLVSPLQLACCLIAVVSVAILPFAVHGNYQVYVVALSLLHVVLAVPSIAGLALSTTRTQQLKNIVIDGTSSWGVPLEQFYGWTAGACMTMHFINTCSVIAAQCSTIWDVPGVLMVGGWRNVCQSSISFDVVFTTLAMFLFVTYEHGLPRGLIALGITPFTSLGGAFSLARLVDYKRENVHMA